MILLTFATEIEAGPFIDHHGLKEKDIDGPYGLYEKGNISLIITGMGSIKGAVYLSDLIQKKKRKGVSIKKITNYGIAGCLSDKFCIGDVVEIDKVIKYNPVEFSKPKPNKHFVPASKFHRSLINKAATSPQDDPRSTLKIIQDVLHKYDVKLDPKTTTRLDAFELWRKLEDEANGNPLKTEKSSNSADGAGSDPRLTRDKDQVYSA